MCYAAQVAQQRRVRFIYRGSVLEETTITLRDLNVTNNTAIHVHITGPQTQTTQGDTDQGNTTETLDLSNFFAPLFGVMLGLVWCCFLLWPHVFSLLTKISLFFLSLGYVVLAYATMT